MAKQHGLGQRYYHSGYDISGDVNAITKCSGKRAALPLTGIDKSAMERTLGRSDGELAFGVWFNSAVGQEHPALSPLPTADVQQMWVVNVAIGGEVAVQQAKQVNYDWQRAEDGSLKGAVQGLVSDGDTLHWGKMLTAGKITGTAAQASVDDGAGTTNGAHFFLQHFTATGVGPAVYIVEDSVNNSVWVTRCTFTSIASPFNPTAEKKTITGTIQRYVRAGAVSGITSATYAMAYSRRDAVADI